ncbi:MAG TPA: hypothetical protein VLA93_11820 [Pyrinomonadaceae bacterium]|nr:hypothetical protein [Pyrinomonadaceae bacterium]
MKNTTRSFSHTRPVFISTFLFGFFALIVVPTSAFGQTTPRSTVGKPGPEQSVATVGQPAVAVPTTTANPAPATSTTPAPTPKPANPFESLRNAKVIFVRSHSLLVGQSVIESKLRKRKEFQQLGLMITRDPVAADLILEVKHDILTKYVFTAIDPWTNIVVASGKLSSLGGTVAGKVAKRFMKQVMKARTQPGP